MEILFAGEAMIEAWMMLVEKMRDSFPGLETKEALEMHSNTVLDFMRRHCAICAYRDGRVCGALLFSAEEGMLCFLAVDPEFRRQGLGKGMVEKMLTCLPHSKNVVVTTYREDDPAGAAARAFYARLGFMEGALTEEFGTPVQQFVLKR